MQKLLRSAALSAALALVAAPLAAQAGVHNVTLTGLSGHNFNYGGGSVSVGPYTFSIPDLGSGPIDLFCDDYTNHAFVGEPWTANFTRMSDVAGLAANARFGQLGATQTQYLAAAYLASQFSSHPTEWAAIHAALWHVFTTAPDVSGLTSTFQDRVTYWTGQALTWAKSVNPYDWYVVTDVKTTNGVGGAQEFLFHATPEPATLILLGTGLALTLGMGVVTRRLG